jgi:hypothetical protein
MFVVLSFCGCVQSAVFQIMYDAAGSCVCDGIRVNVMAILPIIEQFGVVFNSEYGMRHNKLLLLVCSANPESVMLIVAHPVSRI